MDTLQCSFCAHENPVGAKFCNACGSSLTLQLCRECGAIDHISSRNCYKCGAPLDGADAATEASLAPTEPTVEPAPASGLLRESAHDPNPFIGPLAARRTEPGKRPWGRAALLVVAVMVGAALLYRLYVPRGVTDPRAAASAVVDAVSGAVMREPAIPPLPTVPVSVPTANAVPPSGASHTDSAIGALDAPASRPSAGTIAESPPPPEAPTPDETAPTTDRTPIAAARPAPTAAPSAPASAPRRARTAPPPTPVAAPNPQQEESPPRYPCTDAVIALGLCD